MICVPNRERLPESGPSAHLSVPKTSSASFDQAVFADRAVGANLSSIWCCSRSTGSGGVSGRGAVQGAVRPVLIVVGLVIAHPPAAAADSSAGLQAAGVATE